MADIDVDIDFEIPDTDFTVKGLKQYCLRKLGHPHVKVEIDSDGLNECIKDTVLLYAHYKPILKNFTAAVGEGGNSVDVPKENRGLGVFDVQIPRLDPIAPLLLSSGPKLDIFGYRYSYPYRDISELNYDYNYFDMATRVLSSEFDWGEVRQNDGSYKIMFSPKALEAFTLTYVCAHPVKSLNDVEPQEQDWFKGYCLALVKEIVGRVRSKYDRIPGVQSDVRLDGPQLLAESAKEKTDLTQELILRSPFVGFLKA